MKNKRKKIFIGVIILLLVASFIGFKVYFKAIYPIDDIIRKELTIDIKEKNITYIEYNDIPQIYKDAIISTEDRSFYNNIGLSPTGIVRSIWTNLKASDYTQGGSTITQQLVRNAHLSLDKTLGRKIIEIIEAVGLSDNMSKTEIITLYINVINYGNEVYGLHNASVFYFEKEPKALSEGELTFLAGLPNAPNLFNPYKNMDLAKNRQKEVVYNMVENHLITNEKADQILKQPIILKK